MKKIFVLLFCLVAAASFAGDITPNGFLRPDLYQFLSDVKYGMNNYAVEDCTLTASGAKVNLADDTDIVVAGSYKATVASADYALSGQVVPAGKSCVFLLAGKADNSVVVLQGPIGNSTGVEAYPHLTNDYAVFGAVKVVADASTAFTPGSSLLASHTVTLVDLARRPMHLNGLNP